MKPKTKAVLRHGVAGVLGFALCWALIFFRVLPSPFYEQRSHPDLAWLKTADPVADFRRDVAAGELRFWGVSGGLCSQSVPGVPEHWKSDLVKARGVRLIPHTSLCFPSQWSDHEMARSYAERYNSLLRLELEP